MAQPAPSEELKAEIVEYAEANSIEKASALYGYSVKTIAKWQMNNQIHSLTHARITYTPEEWQEQMKDLLRSIAVIAATRELELAPRSEIGFVNKIRTTAIHDLQLLEGKATERHESTAMTEKEAAELARKLSERNGE
jgi:hypothetical protein